MPELCANQALPWKHSRIQNRWWRSHSNQMCASLPIHSNWAVNRPTSYLWISSGIHEMLQSKWLSCIQMIGYFEYYAIFYTEFELYMYALCLILFWLHLKKKVYTKFLLTISLCLGIWVSRFFKMTLWLPLLTKTLSWTLKATSMFTHLLRSVRKRSCSISDCKEKYMERCTMKWHRLGMSTQH